MQKKTIAGLIAIVAIVAAVIFAGCVEESPSAPTETPTPTPETELSLGESAILDDIEFTVVRFEESHEYEYECEYWFNKTVFNETVYPAEGAKFLWMYVIAKNVGEVAREVPDGTCCGYGDIEMLYKGEKIFTIEYSSRLKRKIYDSTGMFSDPLYPGVTDEGWILFEVPKGINISQAKICVDFEERKTMTWSLTS